MKVSGFGREVRVVIFMIVLVTGLVYAPYWVTSDLIGYKDQFYQDHALRVVAAQQWREGRIPLWNPWNFTGDPLAAQIYVGIFYWPNAVYLLFRPVVANKIMILLAHLILGLGVWVWLRSLRLHPEDFISGGIAPSPGHRSQSKEEAPASFFAPNVHKPKGTFFRSFKDVTSLCLNRAFGPIRSHRWFATEGLCLALAIAAALLPTRWMTQSFTGRDTFIWLPWMAWSLHRLWKAETRTWRWVMITAVIWSTAFLAGHAHLWFYDASTAIIFVFFVERFHIRRLIRSFAAAFLFLLLVSPQLVATYPMAIESPRLDPGFCTQQFHALPPDLFLFFVPGRNARAYIPANAYIPPVYLIAVILYVISGRKTEIRFRRFFGVTLVLGIILGVTPWPCSIPILRNMRTHMRYMATGWFIVLLVGAALYLHDRIHRPPVILRRDFLYGFLPVTGFVYGYCLVTDRMPPMRMMVMPEIWVLGAAAGFIFLKGGRGDGRRGVVIPGVILGILFGQGLELHHLIRMDLATAYWAPAARKRARIRQAAPNVRRWFIYTYQDEPWTGLEANLNAVDRMDQASLYPGAVGNYVLDHLVMVMARWQPEIWHWLGAEATVVPTRAYRAYETYRLFHLSRFLGFRNHLPFGSRGCLWIRQGQSGGHFREGWILSPVHRGPGDSYEIARLRSDGSRQMLGKASFSRPPLPACERNGRIRVVVPGSPARVFRWNGSSFQAEGRFPGKLPVDMIPDAAAMVWDKERIQVVQWKNGMIQQWNYDRTRGEWHGRSAGKRMIDLLPFTIFREAGEVGWYAVQRPLRVKWINRNGDIQTGDLRIPLNAFIMKFYQHILNTRWVYLRNPRWHKVVELADEGLEVWTYDGTVFPFAWYVRRAIYMPWESFKTQLLLGGIRRWFREAVVADPSLVMKFPADTSGQVKVVMQEPDRFVLELEGKAGLVVIRLRPYPCWQFALDGKRIPSFRANYVMQAVRVPAGHHRLVGRCRLRELYRFTARHLWHHVRGRPDPWDRFFGLGRIDSP